FCVFFLPFTSFFFILSLHDALPILARLGKLAALVLDFFEKTDILDRDRSLVSKCLDYLDLLLSERPYFGAGQSQNADGYALAQQDRKSTRLNSSHGSISYAVFCLKK